MKSKSRKTKTAAGKTSARKKPGAKRKPVVKKTGSVRKSTTRKKTPAKKGAVARTPSKKPAGRKGAKKKKFLTAAQRRKIRQVLIEMRSRLTDQVASLRDDSLRRDDSGNIEEEGTDAFERQFALSLARSEQDSIVAIDDALRRLDTGEYGKCEECGEAIEIARLEALPFVRTCIGCQSEKEKTIHRRRAF